jgi:hypothetical protein
MEEGNGGLEEWKAGRREGEYAALSNYVLYPDFDCLFR